MADLTIPQGDKGFDLHFTIKNAAGAVVDLTKYDEVILKVWKPGTPGALIVEGDCEDLAEDGTCYYTVLDADFDTIASYKMELELIIGDAVVESTKNYDLRVEESG